MINAKIFSDPGQQKVYRDASFNLEHGEEGRPGLDRPLIIQFAANDPTALLESAKTLQSRCDAIDINFGCPQDIARRGRYGAYLCDDWALIYKLINTLHLNLDIPVTAKFRIFSEPEKTIEYAKMMESAGAQILTCHGRTREQRGHKSGLADWTQIAAVKKAVSVPVFANGNVLYPDDVQKCLDFTGADAYMSAEPQLHNPAIFWSCLKASAFPKTADEFADCATQRAPYPLHADLALEYLSIVSSLHTPTTQSAIRAHLFRLLNPALSRETDLRERLGKVSLRVTGVEAFVAICQEMKSRMDRDAKSAGWSPSSPDAYDFPTDPLTGLKTIPHWLAQPKVRPPPPPPKPAPVVTPKKPAQPRPTILRASVVLASGTPSPQAIHVPPFSGVVAIADTDCVEDAGERAQAEAILPTTGEKRRLSDISTVTYEAGVAHADGAGEVSKRSRPDHRS